MSDALPDATLLIKLGLEPGPEHISYISRWLGLKLTSESVQVDTSFVAHWLIIPRDTWYMLPAAAKFARTNIWCWYQLCSAASSGATVTISGVLGTDYKLPDSFTLHLYYTINYLLTLPRCVYNICTLRACVSCSCRSWPLTTRMNTRHQHILLSCLRLKLPNGFDLIKKSKTCRFCVMILCSWSKF